MLSKLIRHTSNYSVGSLLITLASIISFPIFTRLFTVSEYGTLGLISATLAIFVGIGKLGLQHSIFRFYAEAEANTRDVSVTSLMSTGLIGMAATGATATALCAIGAVALPPQWWGMHGAEFVLALASPLILIRVLDSGLLILLRAQQRSAFYSLLTVIRKYLGLAFILLLLFGVAHDLRMFFFATLISEAAALAWLAIYYRRQRVFSLKHFSSPLLWTMIAFSLPLLASEISQLFLAVGGRYIINAQLGAEALGSFSAAFNFSEYVQVALIGAFAQAIIPMYFKIWEQSGKAATSRFLQESLRYYIIVAIAVFAGMAAVGSETLRMLASARYDAGGSLIPLIIAGMLISGGTPIFSAGVYIKKQTKVVLYSVLAAAAVNLVLTAILTRTHGIAGAATAALLSYILYSACTAYFGRHTVEVRMPWLDLAKFSLLAYIMYWAVKSIHISVLPLQLIAQILCGAVVYAALLLASDAQIRNLVRNAMRRHGRMFVSEK